MDINNNGDNDILESTVEAKDMKKKIPTPEFLKENYAEYEKALKKAFIDNKKTNSLENAPFIFISNFQVDSDGLEHPILFLGELNSAWKQAIRKDFKLRTTFSHGICKLDVGEGDKPALKLTYKGGKGAKNKNLLEFKKEHKKYFSNVFFEKFMEDGKAVDEGKTFLELDEDLGDKYTNEFTAILNEFKKLQTIIPVLKDKLKTDPKSGSQVKKSFDTYIKPVELAIENWKNAIAENDRTDKETEKAENIEAFITKLKAQLKGTPDAERIGTAKSVYMMTQELSIIESDIAELRQLVGSQVDLLDREVLLKSMENQIKKWYDNYDSNKTNIIYVEENDEIAKYNDYVEKAMEKLGEREEALGFKELCRDIDDLEKRVDAYLINLLDKPAEQIRFFLDEHYTINQQFTEWYANNTDLLAKGDYSKYVVAYNSYTTKLSELHKILKTALETKLGTNKFNWVEEEKEIIKRATGYNLADGTILKEQTTLSKDFFKKITDKSLKKALDKKVNSLKKIDQNDIEGKRYHLWELEKELANYLKINKDTIDGTLKNEIEATIEELTNRIKEVAKIEANSDVFEDLIALYEKFLTLKTAFEHSDNDYKFENDGWENKNKEVQAKKEEIEKETDPTAKKILEDEVEKLRTERHEHRVKRRIPISEIKDTFSKIEELEVKFGHLVVEWNQKYQGVRHFDTEQRSKDIRGKREEIYAFFKEKKDFYAKLSGEDLSEMSEYLEKSINSHLKDYKTKDSRYETMKKDYEMILAYRSDQPNENMEYHFSTYNTKKLKEIKDKTSLWLFEAHNLYHPLEELSKRIVIIEDYQNRLTPLSEYVAIKTQHFDLQQTEKQILATMKELKGDMGYINLHITQLENIDELENDDQKREVLMSAITDYSMILSGMTSGRWNGAPSFELYQKKYNQEVLHLKKSPEFGLDQVEEANKYYLGLFKYLRDEVQRVKTQELQNTLSEMEKNKLAYENTQKAFLQNEVDRLSKEANHPLEKSLMVLITDIQKEFQKELDKKKGIEDSITACREKINELKIEISHGKSDLKEELKTKTKEETNLKHDLEEQNKAINNVQVLTHDLWDALCNLNGENLRPITTALDLLATAISIDTPKTAFIQELDTINDGHSDLKESVSILHKYVVYHKKSITQLLNYDIEDLSFKANQKILKSLYPNGDYATLLDTFMEEKTALHKKVKDIVSGNNVKDLKKVDEKILKKALGYITEWEAKTMPLIGEGAKNNIKILAEQANDLKKYKFRLLQSNENSSYSNKDINKYYELIDGIGELFKDSQDNLKVNTDLKSKIKTIKERFYYYKELLFQSIEKAYASDGVTAEDFCNQMFWTNNIKRAEMRINEFIDMHSFDELKADFIAEQLEELQSIKDTHANVLKTDFDIPRQDITDFENKIEFASLTKLTEVKRYWENEVQDYIEDKEYQSLMSKKDEHQDFLHKELFMYRGVSSMTIDELGGNVKDIVELICARANRLLELGRLTESQDLVRNIPATFLSKNFVAAKRIFDEVDAILQGEETENKTTQTLDNMVTKGGDTVKAALSAVDLESFGKAYTKNYSIIETFGEYSKAGALTMKFDKDTNKYSIEVSSTATQEQKDFVAQNEAKLIGEAETDQKIATGAIVLSGIAIAIQAGFDVKNLTDQLLQLHNAEKSGDLLAEQRYAKIVGLNLLATMADWSTQALTLQKSIGNLVDGQGFGTLFQSSAPLGGADIAKGVLTIAATLFKFAAAQEGAKMNRKEFWKKTTDNVLDLGVGVGSVLSAFQVPGAAIVGDVFLIMKDIKAIIEAEAAYREAKRKAHYMKVLKKASEDQESDYSHAMKGIHRQAKKERQAAGVALASSFIDLGLDTIQLSGDIVNLTPAAPIGAAMSLSVKITKALKTGVLLGREIYLEYKSSQERKEVKKLLTLARGGDLDAIGKIQEKSIQYAKAFLIYGVMDTAKDDGEAVTLRKDSVAAAYIEETDMNINEGTAQEIIRAQIGQMDIGMFTHRFETYHNEYKSYWGKDQSVEQLIHKMKGSDLSIPSMEATVLLNRLKDNKNFGKQIEISLNTFIGRIDMSLKAFKEVQIYKNEHQILNFIDKKIGHDGVLTKVSNEQKSLLQAVDEVIKNTALPNFTEVINSLDLDDDTAFEHHKLLNVQRRKLEMLLTKIPQKALVKS